MPLGRPVQPLIFVTQTDLGWTTEISPGSTRSTLPRMFTPPTTPSPTLGPGDPPMTPTKSSGRRPRTPLTRPPPSSLALKNVQRSSHTHSEASSSARPHTAGADAHYSDVFGSRLDSPFQQQYDGEVVWIKNQKVDDEADLDGFRLATSPDPFKIGSREEIRASMEMEMPILPQSPGLGSPFQTPRPKKSSKLANDITPTSTPTTHRSESPSPLPRPPMFLSPSGSSTGTASPLSSSSVPCTPNAKPTGYFPSPAIAQSPTAPSIKFGTWSPMKSLRKRERKEEGLVGLGITSRRGSAGLEKLDTAMMANLHIPDFSDDITPTGSKPQMRLSPAMVSRSRSATPTALTIGTSSSESDGSNSSSTTGSASTAPPTSATGSTRTSRRAMATASLKRIFRQTFQSPKGGRSGSSTVSSRSPSRSPGRNLGEALERMHGGFLPEIPRVDTVLSKDFDEVGARTGNEWEERQAAGSSKSRDARVRRVSTLGVTRGRPLRRSRTEIGVWFNGSSPNRPATANTMDSPRRDRRPALMRTDDSVIYPGSPTSVAIKREMKSTRAESPTPQRRRASSSSVLHAYRGHGVENELHDQEDDSNTGSETEDDEWEGSEESFTSAPMLSPRDVEVVFSHDHRSKSGSDVLSPSSTYSSSNGGSTWKYSRYGTARPAEGNKTRRSIQHMLDQTGFLNGGMVQTLATDRDDERKESQRSYALARLEGRTEPRIAPDWTSIFAPQRVGSSGSEESA